MTTRRPDPWHVFINCPFDPVYRPLLRAMQFTIHACGFVPRCGLEEDNAAEVRVRKIMRLINECALSIHDISCTELDRRTRLPRFNMPFELGLCLGHTWNDKAERARRVLILDRERYRYDIFLSDIAGQDIRSHDNTTNGIISAVRKWLSTQMPHHTPPGSPILQQYYRSFDRHAAAAIKKAGFSPDDLSFKDWSTFITNWLTATAAPDPKSCPLCGK